MTSVAHPTLPHCPIPMIGGTRSTRSQSECSPSRRGPMGPQSTAAILRYCFGRISAGSREKRALQVSSFELGPCGFADHRYAFECIGAHPDRFLPCADTLVVVPRLNIPIPRVLFTLFLACCQDDG